MVAKLKPEQFFRGKQHRNASKLSAEIAAFSQDLFCATCTRRRPGSPGFDSSQPQSPLDPNEIKHLAVDF